MQLALAATTGCCRRQPSRNPSAGRKLSLHDSAIVMTTKRAFTKRSWYFVFAAIIMTIFLAQQGLDFVELARRKSACEEIHEYRASRGMPATMKFQVTYSSMEVATTDITSLCPGCWRAPFWDQLFGALADTSPLSHRQ